METEEATPKRRRFTWIWAVVALAIIGTGIWITREQPSPFIFLNKYQVAEKRSSKDGRLRILILKADARQVWSDIRAHFSSKPVFTSSSYMNVNGQATEYMSIGTADGVIKLSDDLTFADEGFGTTIQMQNIKPGYCAVAFTRPPTIFDKMMDWIHDHMGGGSKEPPRQEVAPPEPTIRV